MKYSNYVIFKFIRGKDTLLIPRNAKIFFLFIKINVQSNFITIEKPIL